MSKFDKQIAALPNKEKLASVDVDLVQYGLTAANLLEQAKRAEITDAESYATGGDLIAIARTQSNKVEDLRKKLGSPFHATWKFINETFGVTKNQFAAVPAEIEPKMLAWKRKEDARLAEEARIEAKRIEEEALAKAALETTNEAQDEVMDSAAQAAVDVVDKSGQGLARGNYGSSTGTRKVYSTNVINQLDFLRALIKHIDDGNARNIEIGGIVEFRKSGLNKLAQDMIDQKVKKMPGAEFTASDKIRVY